jgi:hypothetical protein
MPAIPHGDGRDRERPAGLVDMRTAELERAADDAHAQVGRLAREDGRRRAKTSGPLRVRGVVVTVCRYGLGACQ